MKRRHTKWRQDLASTIIQPDQLDLPESKAAKIEAVSQDFPMRIPPAFLSRMDLENPRCPVALQVIPDARELDLHGDEDPLEEENHWVVPGIVQRFPDRLLALVSSSCPIHCRHCNRKRYWKGRQQPVAGPDELLLALKKRPKTREIIFSGGDPLMLADNQLARLLGIVRDTPNIDITRIHTRVPCSLPSRITTGLVGLLKRHQPLWMSVQFNHASELGIAQKQALIKLRNAGIPVLNQAVLLRGINDSVKAQYNLGKVLLVSGVKPHYLFQLDRAAGTLHFQVPTKKAQMLIHRLRSRYSGLLIPHLLLDLPGNAGKVSAAPSAVIDTTDRGSWYLAPDGNRIFYPEDRNAG